MSDSNERPDGTARRLSATQLGWAAANRQQAASASNPEVASDYKSGARNYIERAREARTPGGPERLLEADAAARGISVRELKQQDADRPASDRVHARVYRNIERAERAVEAGAYWQSVVEQGRAQQKSAAAMTQGTAAVETGPRRSARQSV